MKSITISLLNHPAAFAVYTILGVSIAHYIFIVLYSYLCIPIGWLAPLRHISNLGSPLCLALNAIQYELSKNYILIWTGITASLVTWIITKIKITS